MEKNEKYEGRRPSGNEKSTVNESYGNKSSWGENGTTTEERGASKYIKE